MKKVALVGFSPISNKGVPYDDPDVEIWSLNEAYHFDFLKRLDLLFQIHGKWDFTRENNFNDPGHWKWLQNEGNVRDPGFPIIMQEAFPFVPGSIRFPMEEVQKEHNGKATFSCTFSYMMAYAIHVVKADYIGVYGFDMESSTEYMYQRANAEFWIGYAKGKGIDVYIPPESTLCRGPMYGYDFSRHITDRHIQTILVHQTEIAEKERERFKETENRHMELSQLLEVCQTESVQESHKKLTEKLSKEIALANIQLGMKQELEFLLDLTSLQHKENPENVVGKVEFNGFLNRQHLVFRKSALEQKMAEVSDQRSMKIGYRNAFRDLAQGDAFEGDSELELAKLEENIARMTGMANTIVGRIGIISYLIRLVDMQHTEGSTDLMEKIRTSLEEQYVETQKEAQ